MCGTKLRWRLLTFVVVGLVLRGVYMANQNTDMQEVERLLELLNADAVHPAVLESKLKEFTPRSKDEVVARTATSFEPAPSGKLLARLPLILSEQNKADMVAAFVVNLRSPEAAARKFSLYGLEGLKHPQLDDFALLSLRDGDDQVVYAACYILMPKARHDARLRKVLQSVYNSRKDQKEFYMSMSYLKAEGIEKPAP